MSKLSTFQVNQTLIVYACCENAFSTVNFIVTLKRKPLFYIVNLIIPCVIVTSSGILTFCLPSDAGEKMSVSVTILLTTVVFLIVVSEYMPVQSLVIPQIGNYFQVQCSYLIQLTQFSVKRF